MDERDGQPAPPARRSPAQKAAQNAGLPPGVALHQDAMGGFTSSGRKPKRLKPGDLSAKPKRRSKEARVASTQRVLELPDDDIVVIPSMSIPRQPLVLEDHVEGDEAAEFPAPEGSSLEDAARATIAQTLFHEIGRSGSLMTHKGGLGFSLRANLAEGQCHTKRRVSVPLPGGNSSGHIGDFVIELDSGGLLLLDVLSSQSTLEEVKAHAFDALQLRGVSDCFAILVFLHGNGGLSREQVEALAHGYDHFFGLNAEYAKDSARLTALRARVVQWVKAASRPKAANA
jgi:hypothetical protein